MDKLPNFVIVGAGKSGTTALYEYLAEHPDVFMSPVKETNFFALEGTEMVEPKDDPNQEFHYPWSVTNWDDYQRLFDGVTNEKAIGEVSPMYLYSPDAAKQLKQRLPNVKIIAILRDPVDRLYSRYMHLARENREPSRRFEDALEQGNIWWKRNDLVQEGFYHTHLLKYYEQFPETQIKVFLYEDLKKDPLRVIQSIYDFIGVDGWYEPDFSVEYNVSGKIQNKAVDRLIGQNSKIKSLIAKVSPTLLNTITRNMALKKWVNKLRKKNLHKAPLSTSTRMEMINKIYRNEVQQLQQLINRDLNNWLTIQ